MRLSHWSSGCVCDVSKYASRQHICVIFCAKWPSPSLAGCDAHLNPPVLMSNTSFKDRITLNLKKLQSPWNQNGLLDMDISDLLCLCNCSSQYNIMLCLEKVSFSSVFLFFKRFPPITCHLEFTLETNYFPMDKNHQVISFFPPLNMLVQL